MGSEMSLEDCITVQICVLLSNPTAFPVAQSSYRSYRSSMLLRIRCLGDDVEIFYSRDFDVSGVLA